uniref:Cyclin N-terminal domain-containing protein n=1 Tax=Panagrellus redivivus TaxID=6233 RepID=A0A7E5A1I4_PANRE
MTPLFTFVALQGRLPVVTKLAVSSGFDHIEFPPRPMNRKRTLGRRRATASSKASTTRAAVPKKTIATVQRSEVTASTSLKSRSPCLDSTLSENDVDVPSSSAGILDSSRQVQSGEKAAPSNRKPFQEIRNSGDDFESECEEVEESFFRDTSDDETDLNAPPSKRQSLMPLGEKNEFAGFTTPPRTPTSFRQFTHELHRRSNSFVREPPAMLNTIEMGSPKRVWSLLVAKDEIMAHSWRFEDHPDINPGMRAMIVDWLMDVCHERKLHRETFHLAVDFLDRFMRRSKDIQCSNFQATATAALCIACKMEEIYPPKLSELVEYTDGGCDNPTAVNLEQTMLVTLEWNFSPVTAIAWLKLYLQLLSKMTTTEPEAVRRRSNRLRLSQNSESDGDEGFETSQNIETSPLFSIDGHNTSLDVSLADSGYSEFNTSYSEGHIIVDRPDSVPKLMREEFVQLARVIDLLIMDHHFLKYRYGELAAAVMFCAYEPASCVEQITGIKKDEIFELVDIVQYFVDYCMKNSTVLEGMLTQLDVSVEDRHNIQVYRRGYEQEIKQIHGLIQQKKQEHAELHKNVKAAAAAASPSTPKRKPFRMA